MNRFLSTLCLMALTLPLLAQHPNSVYVRPCVRNGERDFRIEWSLDGKHWNKVECNLFESDFGAWGTEKKIYYPVMSYDGEEYMVSFIPNPKLNQTAITSSRDFSLFKPQEYPYHSEEEFNRLLQEHKQRSANNVIRIPYSGLENLLAKKTRSDLNARMAKDDFIARGKALEQDCFSAEMTIDLDDRKEISSSLMGIFFEDISYAADGGLYAELIQNRDFEYCADDHKGWDAKTAWSLQGEGSLWSIGSENPIHPNNPHYTVLESSAAGARLVNSGWDGIALKADEKYDLSLFLRGKGSVRVSLISKGRCLASTVFRAGSKWKRHKATFVPLEGADDALLSIEPLSSGRLDIDFVSLFPRNTFRGHQNGLRADLAEAIEELHPRFVRFPGGCATHGQGIDNIYHWQSSIGELWERKPDFNIWGYHQTKGLGFYEYFLFCEDIGAEPLPVLAAGVPCQNSRKGGAGQQGGIPFEAELLGKPSPYSYNGKPLTMESYLQELLDLIEWANGDPKTSELAALRAKAGHPEPFNMKYLGIGNEDLVSEVFLKRYCFLVEGVRKAHPEITVIGTVGPFWEGSDYEYGWQEAKRSNIAIVDEHYYNPQGWYYHHRDFYDSYAREGTKVYLGEWASQGNNVSNALVEAAYLCNLERNADVVVMSSYAPLLAKEGHESWNPDLIYFNNTEVHPTANYYVQRAFGRNAGSEYVYSLLAADGGSEVEQRLDRSVVIDPLSGDLIIKIVSLLPRHCSVKVNLHSGAMDSYCSTAEMSVLSKRQNPESERNWDINEQRQLEVAESFTLDLDPYSLSVIRIHKQ